MQQIKERGALPMIDRGDIRQAIDRCSNIWASLPGAGYGQFEQAFYSLIAKFKEAVERSERLMYEQSHRDYLRSGYLHHRLPVMGYIITVITPLPTAPARQKMPENCWRTRQLLTCRCVSVMLLRSMQNTRSELADAKAENDACVMMGLRWSSSVAHQSSLSAA